MKGITIFSVIGNLHRRKADLNYMQIFYCMGGLPLIPALL